MGVGGLLAGDATTSEGAVGRQVTQQFREDLVAVTAHYACSDDEIVEIKGMVRKLDDDEYSAMVQSFRAMAHEIAPRSMLPTISEEEADAMGHRINRPGPRGSAATRRSQR